MHSSPLHRNFVLYPSVQFCSFTEQQSGKKRTLISSVNNKCWSVEKKGPLLHCWWECKLAQPQWRTVWRGLQKLKIELPYNPAMPLLGIYPAKNNNNNNSKRYVRPSVHRSTIYNSQDPEVT